MHADERGWNSGGKRGKGEKGNPILDFGLKRKSQTAKGRGHEGANGAKQRRRLGSRTSRIERITRIKKRRYATSGKVKGGREE
jgi:hypothetical protein